MSLGGNCGKSGQTNLIFAWCCLLVWFCKCRVSIGFSRLELLKSPLCVIACLLQSVPCILQDFCPFIQQGLAELTKILGKAVHTGDCTSRFILNMFYGVAVWRSCKLLHLGDVALLKKFKDYPCTVGCGVIALVAVVITEILPGKWH